MQSSSACHSSTSSPMPKALPQPLHGVRILSLALNLPGPAALLRCARMGAICTKLEPPAAHGQPSADPMAVYSPEAYRALHPGMRILQAHLKTERGQAMLHEELTKTDVLLTSFRPSALSKLGLSWDALHQRYPRLSLVRIVGALGAQAEEPGHDLTYLADAGLLTSTEMPATLYADMGGALMTSEAVLQALLARAQTGEGQCIEVALADAAAWLAQPRTWGLTTPEGDVGGQHAGYRIYPCADGRVAVAALEPHFAVRLCAVAGSASSGSVENMRNYATHVLIENFMRKKTRDQLNNLALTEKIPLKTIKN